MASTIALDNNGGSHANIPSKTDTCAMEFLLPEGGLDPYPKSSYISRLVLQMKTCFDYLKAKDVTFPRLEQMAVLIHESMSSSSRNYHSVQHVFDISKGLRDPIAILAAFFHDVIYYHVDGGLTPIQAKILSGVFQTAEDGTQKFLAHEHPTTPLQRRDYFEQDDDLYLVMMVEMIFGFTKEGEEITTMRGLNEFLSAVIALRELSRHLPMEMLAQIACCIEATIPFRKTDTETGIGPLDRLFDQMCLVRNKYGLLLTDDELVRSVQRAVIVSNEDVGNFGTQDRHWFLDNTWSLLPETNESLRQQYLFTIKQYHHAVFKMYGFFNFLQPSVVFQAYKGVPTAEELDQKTKECIHNLHIGKQYVGAKLLALSVLAAFAELTGGDTPMSLFMGDLPSRHRVSTRLTDDLHLAQKTDPSLCNDTVYTILAHGRRTETQFDIRQSPLAAFLYGHLGDEALSNLLKTLKQYPMDEANSWALLSSLPIEAVEPIGTNMAKVALSRATLIEKIVMELEDKQRQLRKSSIITLSGIQE